MTDFANLVVRLLEAGVEFIVIGGVAATAHGAARTTLDLDELIRIKRAVGRPKDFEAIAELELLLDLRR